MQALQPPTAVQTSATTFEGASAATLTGSGGMREEETFIWRIMWGGRWTKTGIHYSEEAIRKEHPEALRLDDTRKVRLIPQTDAEYRELARKVNSVESTHRTRADGTPIKMWERE